MAAISEFRRTSRPMDSELDLNYDPHRDGANAHPYMTPTPTGSVSMFNGRDPPPSLPPVHYQPHSAFLSGPVTESSRLAPEGENPFNPPSNQTRMDVDPFMERGGSDTIISASRRKSAMSGSNNYKPSRYVLHTDAEDDDLPANEDGVVELPPQYSATRGVVKGSQQSNAFNPPPL